MNTKMNNRSIAALLALCLCVGMLAACTTTDGQTVTVSSTTQATTATTTEKTTTASTTEATGLVTPISPEPVTLTAAVMQDESYGRPTEEVWFWKYLSTFHVTVQSTKR